MLDDQLLIEGFWYAKLDSKLRLTLPTSLANKIPEEDERKFVLTLGYNKNFILRTQSSWDKFYKETVAPLNYNNPIERKLRTKYTRGITELVADSNWRINLPKKLCDLIGVQKEIALHGFGDLVEIWDQTTYDNALDELDEDTIVELEKQRIAENKLPAS